MLSASCRALEPRSPDRSRRCSAWLFSSGPCVFLFLRSRQLGQFLPKPVVRNAAVFFIILPGLPQYIPEFGGVSFLRSALPLHARVLLLDFRGGRRRLFSISVSGTHAVSCAHLSRNAISFLLRRWLSISRPKSSIARMRNWVPSSARTTTSSSRAWSRSAFSVRDRFDTLKDFTGHIRDRE